MDCPFSIEELKRALGRTRNRAPGKDEVCYNMLKQLSDVALNKVLMLFNRCGK